MTRVVKFNVNDNVRVQLTDEGRKIHKRLHEKLESELQRDLPYQPPVEDINGWSTWQLWSLMNYFGSHMHVTGDLPFSTNMQLEVIE